MARSTTWLCERVHGMAAVFWHGEGGPGFFRDPANAQALPLVASWTPGGHGSLYSVPLTHEYEDPHWTSTSKLKAERYDPTLADQVLAAKHAEAKRDPCDGRTYQCNSGTQDGNWSAHVWWPVWLVCRTKGGWWTICWYQILDGTWMAAFWWYADGHVHLVEPLH